MAPDYDSPSLTFTQRALGAVWKRRHYAARVADGFSRGCYWLYDKLPMSSRVREMLRELFFHAVEHRVVQREGYQQWLVESQGLTKLHRLFTPTPLPAHAMAEPPRVPSAEQWRELALLHRTPKETAPLVDVIVPVYKGYDATLACIYSVLRATVETPYQLVVINDASPDHRLSEKLRELQLEGLFDLLHHDSNRGFVASVNHGMQRHEERDVVLLNSDTEVYDGWLDRLRAAAHANTHTATVTPLTNNGDLASYPHCWRTNSQRLECDYAALAAMAAQTNLGERVDIPTGVGFCLYIRREALEETGYFDEQLFGRGYGEENDFCLRASHYGWRHVLAGDVFVRHHGSLSFGAEKIRRIRQGLRKLNKRHPHYRALLREFRAVDPTLPLRQSLDLARLATMGKARPAMLMVSHEAGGGTERHVQDMAARLEAEGVAVYRISPVAGTQLRLWHPHVTDTPNLRFDIDRDLDMMVAVLEALRVRHVHIHHLLGFPARMAEWLPMLAARMGCGYDVTLHDYYFACPSINLIYGDRFREEELGLAASDAYAKRHPTTAGRMPAWEWRLRHGALLLGARSVFTPSEDTAQRMTQLFPGLRATVRPHVAEVSANASLYLPYSPGAPLNVAILGALSLHKGHALVLAMAEDAAERELPIHFHVFGDAQDARALKRTGHVEVHGRYEEGEIFKLLAEHRCHMALLPMIWPETFSYTLSIAFDAQIHPVAFNLGAPPERIRQAGWGTVLPQALLDDAAEVNDTLLALQPPAPPAGLSAASVGVRYPSLLRDYYSGLRLA